MNATTENEAKVFHTDPEGNFPFEKNREQTFKLNKSWEGHEIQSGKFITTYI